MTRNFFFTAAAALTLSAAMALPAISATSSFLSGTTPTPKAPQVTDRTTGMGGKSDASQAARPVKTADVNGWVWQNSDNGDKLSFLLGVENAIAMEYALAQALAQQKGQTTSLSPFQEGWMIAFQTTPRQELVDRIDTFYASHPDQRDRHVFDVVWADMIIPVLPANPTTGK